jgi:hypothetical protein
MAALKEKMMAGKDDGAFGILIWGRLGMRWERFSSEVHWQVERSAHLP